MSIELRVGLWLLSLGVICVMAVAFGKALKLVEAWEQLHRDLRESRRKIAEQQLEIAMLTSCNHLQSRALAVKRKWA